MISELDEENLKVEKTTSFNALRKKKNWIAPGPDKIVNFGLKKLPSIMDASVKIFYKLINVYMCIEKWVSRGMVGLIPKDGEWAISNQRPINRFEYFLQVVDIHIPYLS